MENELEKIRAELDKIDRDIIKSLAGRQQLVKEVSALKQEHASSIRDLKREEVLLGRIRKLAEEEGVDPHLAEHLFREVITNSVRYQTHSLVDHQNNKTGTGRIRVSYQGTAGAYSHLAAERHFGDRFDEVTAIGYNTFREAAHAVSTGAADAAMLPVENTTAGVINETYDILGKEGLYITGEEILKVVHCLLATEEVEPKQIRRILSHPQAIAQCSVFLSSHPRAEVRSYLDTAMSARKVLEDADISQAAIAGIQAADLYGLKVIAHDIANQDHNYTRFVVVSREAVEVDLQLPAKTSLMLVTSNEEGSLIECLNILHQHRINMTKLESRPRLNEPWNYSFYLDIEGNPAEEETAAAIEEMKGKASELKVLGCYARQDR